MASTQDNRNVFEQGIPTPEQCRELRIAIVAAQWNDNVIAPMLRGAIDTLIEHGVNEKNIFVARVPGTIELTYGTRRIIEQIRPHAVITLGCVVRGDTPHFDYVCQSVTQGITSLNADPTGTIGPVPVIFGVITTNNMQQALDRAGGSQGNKGSEGAITALKMCALTATSLTGDQEYLGK